MKPEETIDFHIRWAWSRITRMYNSEALERGGTMSMGYILLNIDKEGTPSTRLGPKMGMEPRSLSRSLKVLEDKGLITRRPDKTDKRMVRVHLTPDGKKMRDESRAVVIRFNERLREEISEEEWQSAINTLQKISTIIDKNQIFELTSHEEKH